MKKTLLVVITVVALIVATYVADKATRVQHKTANTVVQADTPSVGQPAPELTLKDLNGKNVSLSDYKGKIVLVNFWATWCEPCRVEIPWLIDMQEKYGAKGFVILGVAMDEEGKSIVAPFVEKERFDVNGQKRAMNYPILLSNNDTEDKFGGFFGYPTSVLISRDGKQIKRITGIISYDEIAKTIESQL